MKNILLLVLITSFFSQTIKAQEHSNPFQINTDTGDVMPEFPGGIQALTNYLKNNIQYPSLARDNEVQGKVMVSFVIDSTGSIKNAKVEKGLGFGCDEEALRVVNAMPKWSPGKLKGKNVNVSFRLPIRFVLTGDEPKKKKKRNKK